MSMTMQLPRPKRFVVSELYDTSVEVLFTLDADSEVFDFVRLLAPVDRVDIWPPYEIANRAWVRLNKRYAYDELAAKQCYLWIIDQLKIEFDGTVPAPRPQEDTL